MDSTETAQRTRRVRIGVGAAIVLVLIAATIAVLVSALSPHGTTITVPTITDSSSAVGEETSEPFSADNATPEPTNTMPAPLFVHILGEVVTPGLYELSQGDRAIDAVAAAGGLTSAADEQQLNLARFLTDGEQIVVPAVGEAPVAAPMAPNSPGATAGTGLININTADATALEDLPGLGPELASRIVAWREANGRFGSADDLLNVTGIGQKKLDGLRDHVTT
ncbi:MAG TPA: helix-hairpin-helix domain-containing protein [Glaciihabitans sp.]|nr:helix-hairpin-helix domain-containing protein [Glaciihabitans sp.]